MSADCEKQIMKHKLDCDKESTKIRHDFRGEMHSLVGGVDKKTDDNKVKINTIINKTNLFTQTLKTMNDNIEEIKALMKDGFDKIEKNFVTKAEISPYKWGTGLLVAGLIGAFVQKLSSLIF